MKHYVKIYYNKVTDNGNGEFVEKLVTELVPFLKNQTPYEESASYEDNFERFISEAFECGFIMTSSNRAISILQIKEFHRHKPKPKPQQQKKKQKSNKSVSKTPKDLTEKSHESDELSKGKEGKKLTLDIPFTLNPSSKSIPSSNKNDTSERTGYDLVTGKI